jgi:signal transduction histidine kinase
VSPNEVDASEIPSAPAPPPRRGLRSLVDRWPFRRKLNVLVGVPLVVIALLLSYGVVVEAGTARSAASAARLVRDSEQVAALIDRLEDEHRQAVLLSTRYEAMLNGGARPSTAGYQAAEHAVDAQVAKVRATFGSRLPGDEDRALLGVSGLSSLRETVEAGYLPSDNIDPAYTSAADDLIEGLGLEQSAVVASTSAGDLLDSLLRADAAHSAYETSTFSAQTGDGNALIQFVSAVGSYELYTSQADRFARFASQAQTTLLGGIEHNVHENAIALQYAGLQVDPGSLQVQGPQLRAALALALASYPEYQQEAQTRLGIAQQLIGQIADQAQRDSTAAWVRAALLLGVSLLGLALWLALSVAVRRSVARPVLALTGAARQVADATGRELARVADDDTDDSPPRLREVPVLARDEIGELAAAFNQVQATAGALLERQVLSRRNVAEMFGNVGRRVSNLTTRQLTLIDAVEHDQTDPELLERLYRIDHIAVRLQRNADSLMLLAGIREAGLDGGPTPLTNVVRAALGQIEGYQRVSLRAGTDVTVAPDIIGDLTLMLAELLENAVAFSPAQSPVEVAVRAGAEGATVEITDHGLGMSAERLAEENARLVRRERLDLVPTKVLGLFVVGSLARRWGVSVTLSRTPGGGVTSRVAIPSALLLMLSPVVPVGAEQQPEGAAEPAPAAQSPAASRAAEEPQRRSAVLPSAEGGLPRRVPQRVSDPEPQVTPSAADVPSSAPAPLRRRVRGATLRATAPAADREALLRAPAVADAEAVRSALDEFEAAVERAHRDSTPAGRPGTEDHYRPTTDPEGAEQ